MLDIRLIKKYCPPLFLQRYDASVSVGVADCASCALNNGRKVQMDVVNAVEGDEVVLLIGEAPGEQEDIQLKPFVGRSGELLRKVLSGVGIKKYILTNVVKCRPPGNRTPDEIEKRRCTPLLRAELSLIRKKYKVTKIIALGKVAASILFGGEVPDVGAIITVEGFLASWIWHPAFLLR